MTRGTMLSLFDYLCNEARNAVHASFALMDFRPAEGGPAWQVCADATRTSTDRLLASIDDMRELLVNEQPAIALAEEFELSLCLGETIELLNPAFAGHACRLDLITTAPLTIRQSRPDVEQLLTRTLNAAVKQARHGAVRVAVGTACDGRVRIGITPPNSDLTLRLVHGLNANLDEVEFRDCDEVAWGVPLLVAGRHLRALGGTAESYCEAGAPTGLALFFPSEIASAEAPSHRDAPRNALTVLVAEDCDESFAFTQLMLQNETVVRARTGLEVIEMVKKHRFDVVLMDIHMPGLDGYQAIRAIRDWETCTSNARTPIVIVSSDVLTTQVQQAAQSGCSCFLRKPVRRGELLDMLARLRRVRELTN